METGTASLICANGSNNRARLKLSKEFFSGLERKDLGNYRDWRSRNDSGRSITIGLSILFVILSDKEFVDLNSKILTKKSTCPLEATCQFEGYCKDIPVFGSLKV